MLHHLKLTLLFGVTVFSWVNGQTPTPSPDFDCPNKDDAMFPDPRDCSYFFICTNGLAWHESCPPGLLFDSIRLICDWPELVTCAGSGVTGLPTRTTSITTMITTTTTSSTTTTTESSTEDASSTSGGTPSTTPPPSTSTDSATPTTTPTPIDFRCPDLNYHSYPHPQDCAKYYVCDNGVPTLEVCPDGLHFDPTLQVCNWPDVVNCNLQERLYFH